MPHFDIELHISSDEFSKLYRGVATSVRATTLDGQSIRFPARALMGELRRDGVHGVFRVCVDRDHRLQRVQRLSVR